MLKAISIGIFLFKIAFLTSLYNELTLQIFNPISSLFSLKLGILPFPSEENVTWLIGKFISTIFFKASLAVNSPSSKNSSSLLVVKSTYPPSLIYSTPILNKFSVLFTWVGKSCVGGISVFFISENNISILLAPPPIWTLTTPDFPDKSPPTLPWDTKLTKDS